VNQKPTPAAAVRFDVSWGSIVKVLAAAVLVWLWLRLWQWILLLTVAMFLAVGLDPVVGWLDRRVLRRQYAAPLVVLALAAALVGFGYVAGAELVRQGELLGSRISEAQQELTSRLPRFAVGLLPGEGDETTPAGPYAKRFGRSLLGALTSLGVALVLTIYFLLDGRRTYEWLVAFAPHHLRPRVRQTASDGRIAVLAYVRGNVLSSVLAGISAYIFLVVAGVPAPLLLALLTFVFDFIPVIGVFLTAIPMILLALAVSMWTAVATAIFNAVYNAVETYYISPKIYGNQLRLSSLAVVLGFIVGAELGGVIGALVALPLIALYPAVENIWLKDRLAPEVLADHRRIEQSEEH
jgi:predicted PurR-regulated permease PerM